MATTCILNTQDALGEGVVWDSELGALWWVDIPMPSRIHRFDPKTKIHRSWTMDEMVSALAPADDGRLLVACHRGLSLFDPETDALDRVAEPEQSLRGNRANDGKTDPAGRFWYGTMANNIAPDGSFIDAEGATGSLYRVGPDLSPEAVERNVGIPNALCWSPDGRTMYFADTAKSAIFAYDFDLVSGTIANKRLFAAPENHGYPDGATTDCEGYLWNARWEGGCVIRFDPDGGIDRIIEVPAPRVTCCAFGGADLDTLYITTSRAHLDVGVLSRFPQSGGIFAAKPGVRGLPQPHFKTGTEQ